MAGEDVARTGDGAGDDMGDGTVEPAAHEEVARSLADLTDRVARAQALAHMGDYDWHIATDRNEWSDELFRIYGHEPGSFNPSYDRFLASVHPADREMVQATHRRAYETGEPYAMVERIVRPDGEVRYLSSTGEVLMGADGSPERMRGTCIDVTERVLAEQRLEHSVARFEALIETCPDGVLVIDADGIVVHRNERSRALLGGEPIARRLAELVPPGPGRERPVRGLDGRLLTRDVTVVALPEDADAGAGTAAVFLTDAMPRLQRESVALRAQESRQRRRQALEINDNVVQGLAASCYALEQGLVEEARSFLDRTVAAARDMMDRLLETEGDQIGPGELIRSTSADLEQVPAQRGGVTRVPRVRPRVLVVDDAEDIRTLLRLRLARNGGIEVVGEARDGLEAVAMARSLRPDLVLLDMAMPRMDGLEALPLIRDAVPGVRVIVLSGFNEDTMERRALAAGADRYVVKGGNLDALLAAIAAVVAA
jgi:PAS domain S-box-containing protein